MRSPWDQAYKLHLCRGGRTSWTKHKQRGVCEAVDPGVNFFIRSLEELGAEPWYSCDGHGQRNRFFVRFHAPYALARRISMTSPHTNVVLDNNERDFALKLHPEIARYPRHVEAARMFDDLRTTAQMWQNKLGVIGTRVDPTKECTPCRKLPPGRWKWRGVSDTRKVRP